MRKYGTYLGSYQGQFSELKKSVILCLYYLTSILTSTKLILKVQNQTFNMNCSFPTAETIIYQLVEFFYYQFHAYLTLFFVTKWFSLPGKMKGVFQIILNCTLTIQFNLTPDLTFSIHPRNKCNELTFDCKIPISDR